MVVEHFRHSLDSVDDIIVDMDRVEPDPALELDKLWTKQLSTEWRNIVKIYLVLPSQSSLWHLSFYDLI